MSLLMAYRRIHPRQRVRIGVHGVGFEVWGRWFRFEALGFRVHKGDDSLYREVGFKMQGFRV